MKDSWREADRAAAVRDAVAGWREAGLIDDAAVAAARAAYPEAGPALGEVWRALIFLFVSVGVVTLGAGIAWSLGFHGSKAAGALCGALGLGLALATELILERASFAPTGAEAATSLFCVVCLCVSVFAFLDAGHVRPLLGRQVGFPAAAAFLAAASWRWGFRIYAAAAAAFALLFVAQFPAPWLLWSATSALLAWGATRALATHELAPSHRGGLELVRAVALAAAYCAVNYYAADRGWIREIARLPGARLPRTGELTLVAAAAGSILFPLALLAWGIRAREREILWLGVLAAACSLATIRFYIHVAPLWVVLTASGAALAAAAILLERWLRSGADGERNGFTAAPLLDEGRRERLLPLAAALAMAPAARALPEEPRGVMGGGGGFGGGGAMGRF